MAPQTSERVRSHLLARADRLQLVVPTDVVDQLAAYVALLARWNARINLTGFSLDEPGDEALDRLLIEPIIAAQFLPTSRIDWADVGSGGGSPAIPIHLMRPAAALTMIESVGKKAAFLREAVAELGLEGASVAETRFEEFARSHPSSVDWLSVRAVKPSSQFSADASQVLLPGGRVLLFAASSEFNRESWTRFQMIQSCEFPPPLRGAAILLRGLHASK